MHTNCYAFCLDFCANFSKINQSFNSPVGTFLAMIYSLFKLILTIHNEKAKLNITIEGNFLDLLYQKNELSMHSTDATFKHYNIVDL